MTHAHCRRCDVWGQRSEVASRVEVHKRNTYDVCDTCGSDDVDVFSEEGLKHELEGAS